MWETAVPIFEDEDEAQLISRFVELSAKYPNRSAFEICGVVFRDLRDPILRANQAADIWSNNLDILERIDKAKLNGGEEPLPADTKEQVLKKLEAIYNNDNTANRDKLKAMELHARISGHIDGEDDGEGKGRRLPVFNFAVHPGASVNVPDKSE